MFVRVFFRKCRNQKHLRKSNRSDIILFCSYEIIMKYGSRYLLFPIRRWQTRLTSQKQHDPCNRTINNNQFKTHPIPSIFL